MCQMILFICKILPVNLCSVLHQLQLRFDLKEHSWNFPGCPVVKTLPSNAVDAGSIPACLVSGSEDPACLTAKKSEHRAEAIS